MASIFTFEPDPPRVSSPWTAGIRPSPAEFEGVEDSGNSVTSARPDQLLAGGITRLEAEPQEGPTEYKLHLLLRPRRSFSSSTTAANTAGSRPGKSSSSFAPRSFPSDGGASPSVPLAQSQGSRQHRLEQLTTQLLWRLQQSCPHHSSSTSNVILPSLPTLSLDSKTPPQPARLLPGLEESKGALYEIGVSDDGTFVGLTEDEMQESLGNLQAMAACLGCSVEVLRMVPIGECEWHEDAPVDTSTVRTRRSGKLYVAEAYIKPELSGDSENHRIGGRDDGPAHPRTSLGPLPSDKILSDFSPTDSVDQQLRVTLTGATTSGKSTLLGTLSTSTLDNGRGKSRLTLLKHRHEIASGVTSSVNQELVGYHDSSSRDTSETITRVINFASSDVVAWNDIHVATKPGRLAFLSDSAGHPRYRRTTVRGLVGWAPHWTMLCIAANGEGDMTAPSSLPGDSSRADSNFQGAEAHLSMAHLELCLKLNLALVIVVTKLDVASKSSLRNILSTLLTVLKNAGRQPVMLPTSSSSATELELQRVPCADLSEVEQVLRNAKGSAKTLVPIVLTSAVNGTGIGKIHALLCRLPITKSSDAQTEADSEMRDSLDELQPLFHIDDVYDLSPSKMPNVVRGAAQVHGKILSGHLSRGEISLGERLLLGPFSTSSPPTVNPDIEAIAHTGPNDPFLTPRSFSEALAQVSAADDSDGGTMGPEWRLVEVISIRNLRLPVQTLHADHVGTLGVVLVPTAEYDLSINEGRRLRVRRGMVMTSGAPRATQTITAMFDLTDADAIVVGSRVVLYNASVRAPAKIFAVALHNDQTTKRDEDGESSDDDDFAFDMYDEPGDSRASVESPATNSILVTFRLDTYREMIEEGTQVLVMPGGGPGLVSGERGEKGLAGLEGFAGRVVEAKG